VVALSIAKLRVGAEAYQLSGVAQSLDDYYTGAGEAAGRWIGQGAPGLNLLGDVDPDDLRAVLAGLLPGGGGLTPNGTHPGTDGKWSSIVHPHLYQHARAAGEMFQAVVRDELTRSIGVEWRPGRHVHEIAGVPDEIMRVFSKRRTEIDNYLHATGTPADGAGRQAAALATRRSKGEQESTVGLSQRWRTEAIEAGWGPIEVDDLLGTGRPRGSVNYEAGVWLLPTVWFDENGSVTHEERAVDAEEWIADVLRKDLTNDGSTFRVADVVQAVSKRLGDGATVATIERVSDRVLASDQTIPIGDDFTSRELHDTEATLVDTLSRRATIPGPTSERIEHVLDQHQTLGADQAAAVRTLAIAETAVSVLIGPAGTGKTYTLNIVRHLFEDAGWRVSGATPSARAAAELNAGADIDASTMHSLLAHLAQGTRRLDAVDLLIVDEAGMADTRTLQRLVTAATDAGSRVLLVGDHRQLPEVDAGGGFSYSAQHAQTIAQLTVNRRQKEPWEQQALTALRDGNTHEAVDAYLSHRRVIVTPDGASLTAKAVDTWNGARTQGLDAVLLAGTNEMVDQLNTAILDQLTDIGGSLHGAGKGMFAGTIWHVGQQAVIRRNYTLPSDPSIKVRNGQTGTVTAVGEGRISLQLDDAPAPVTLDQGFVEAGGRLAHGYASTIHRAQGGTWDVAIEVGLDGLYREGAYTALSRGRLSNVIILTHPETQQLETERAQDLPRHDKGLRLPTEEPVTVSAQLTDRINKRRGKQLAHAEDPAAGDIDRLNRTLPYSELTNRAARAAQIERIATATIGSTVDALVDRIGRAERTATHITPGVRVKALDRHNIGTVITLNERAATALVRFEAVNGGEATRSLEWSELAVIDPDTTALSLNPT
jgi:hypothetical protein